MHNLSLKEWTTSVLPIGLATAFSLAAANMAYFYTGLEGVRAGDYVWRFDRVWAG